MAAGILLTQSDIDKKVGELARDINQLLESVPLVRDKINSLGTAGMAALPPGNRATSMSESDAQLLIDAMYDLFELNEVYQGLRIIAEGGAVSVGTGHDFKTSCEIIWGFGFD